MRKPVPSVLTANTVPPPELPAAAAVPYSVLPDKTSPAFGFAPSTLIARLPGSGTTVTVSLSNQRDPPSKLGWMNRPPKICTDAVPAGATPLADKGTHVPKGV